MCGLAATNVWLLFNGASWDVKKRELGRAVARALQEDKRTGFGPGHTSDSL